MRPRRGLICSGIKWIPNGCVKLRCVRKGEEVPKWQPVFASEPSVLNTVSICIGAVWGVGRGSVVGL